MKLKLLLAALLLLPAPAQAGSSAYTLHSPGPNIETENRTYTKTWNVPESHQIPGATITGIYGQINYSYYNQDLVMQLCLPETDRSCEVISSNFGTYTFTGEPLGQVNYWFRVITPNGLVPVLPTITTTGLFSITVNYDFPDPEPPELTPREKYIRVQPAVHLLLLDD